MAYFPAPPYAFYRYIVLSTPDGVKHKYPIAAGSYTRKWARAFSSQLAGNIIRLNFIDRGAGIRVYDMTIILNTWDPSSQPYADGVVDTWDTQLYNLSSSYSAIATVLHFEDPLGQSPNPVNGGAGDYGVYFTNFNQIIPNYATPQKPFILAEVEFTEATQVVN
jgi:hypothetical protein